MSQNEALRQRNDLVEQHYDLVKVIARGIQRHLPPSFELDDLIQNGVVGLIHAAERFDPTVGLVFETFARHRVRGAILDSVRRREYTENTHDELPEQMVAVEQDPIEERLTLQQQAERVSAAVAELPHRERKIVEMRYRQEVSMVNIGASLSMSKTRAVQLHKQAIGVLRTQLAEAA